MKLCISNIAWSKNQNAKVINFNVTYDNHRSAIGATQTSIFNKTMMSHYCQEIFKKR